MVGTISRGLLVLVGIEREDGEAEVARMADKLLAYRVFADAEGKMNRSVSDIQGGVLLVSQFTLYGNCRKGMRPSFIGSAPPDLARRLYEDFGRVLRKEWPTVAEGEFGAMMEVSLLNDGPVTLLLDSKKQF